jgi:hypothetical protein
MEHFTPIKESTLAASCWDYAEFNMSDWLDDDEREVTVYMDYLAADHDDCLPIITVIGAVAHADYGLAEMFTRDEFAALIGKKFVEMIEYAKAEECAA